MTLVKDLDSPKYILETVDLDIKATLEYCGLSDQNWSYLFVELDKSGADITRVYGSDSCNLYSTAYLIYTNRFNKNE